MPLLTAVIGGIVTVVGKEWADGKLPNLPFPWALEHSSYIHTLTISSWSIDILKKWSSTSKLSATAQWIEPIGLTLYNAVPKAARGLLVITSSLAETGHAEFLLGCDSEAKNAYVVTLKSTRDELELNAARLAEGRLTHLLGEIRTSRNNQSKHNVSIQFDATSITATVREQSHSWNGLSLVPGFVGFRSSPKSEFRVYDARIALDS